MQRRRSATTALCALVGLVVTALPSFAQTSPQEQWARGSMLGVYLNGATIRRASGNTSNDQHRAGAGVGVTAGWEFTKWLMLYASGDIALANETFNDEELTPDGAGFALGHLDLGLRFSRTKPNHRLAPFVNVALTKRVDGGEHGDSLTKSGGGVTVGGGGTFLFAPVFAMDAALQLTTGHLYHTADRGGVPVNFGRATSARVQVGVKFFPHGRKQ